MPIGSGNDLPPKKKNENNPQLSTFPPMHVEYNGERQRSQSAGAQTWSWGGRKEETKEASPNTAVRPCCYAALIALQFF